MNKNITKIIILIVIILLTIFGIKFLLNTFEPFKENNNTVTIVTLFIIWLIYQFIITCYINQKNKKYMNLPIKQTLGKLIGKVKHIDGSYKDANGNSYHEESYKIAKYSFKINDKEYKKKIYFKENDSISEEMILYYRIGKKDITNKEKPQMNIQANLFHILLMLILTIITYALLILFLNY